MARYVAFFGSMNVGRNRLAMADLRRALEREDFENVETVIASGNVLFEHEDRPSEGLSEKLEFIVRERFEFESVVAVRNRNEVAAAIADNPFAADGEDNLVHTHFLERQPDPHDFETMKADWAERGPERLALGDRSLFIDYVEGVGDSKLSGAFIARRLGCRGTGRNMRSLARILEKLG